jgi:hypothetical protein
MLTTTKAQKLCNAWTKGEESALNNFGSNGIWDITLHRRYLNEVQELINRQETALKPFNYPRAKQIELEQLKHYFDRIGEQNGITTVWHKDYYGLPVPFTTKEFPNMQPIFKLV